MPRHRHDTESDDSDSSDGHENPKERKGGRSLKSKTSNAVSPVRRSRRHDSSSPDSSPEIRRRKDQNNFSSPTSDKSPQKKVGKKTKEQRAVSKESNKQKNSKQVSSSRQLSGSDISPEKKRQRHSDSFSPQGRKKDKTDKSRDRYRRSSSPDKPFGVDNQLSRRDERDDRPRGRDAQRSHISRSPDQPRGPQRGRRLGGRSPNWNDQNLDDRGERGGNRRNEPRSADLRFDNRQGRSGRDADRYARSPLSPGDVRDVDHGRGSDSFSRNDENRGKNLKRGGRKSSLDRDSTEERPVTFSRSGDRNNENEFKNRKTSKDRSLSGRVDTAERETRRLARGSKRTRNESHSDMESPERPKRSCDTDNFPSPVKGKKKKGSKRQRSGSASSDASSVPSLRKPLMKKTKKTSKKTRVSPSPNSSPERGAPTPDANRSQELDRSRSLDHSRSSELGLGHKHDMAQFESEPESGEITDSEEDKESKQAVRSFVNVAKTEGEEGDEERDQISERGPSHDRIPSRERARNPVEGARQRGRGGGERFENRDAVRAPRRDLRDEGRAPRRDNRDDGKADRREGRRERRDRGDKQAPEDEKKSADTAAEAPAASEKKVKQAPTGAAAFTGKTGGAYIPPAKLRAMQANITDKTSVEYQRISWEALKKSINGLVNKVNVSNIEFIVREVFQENIVRGRGLMSRSIIQAQTASPTFTHVYAALVAVVNTKFPQNGELILRRLILQFRRGFRRNDKAICLSSTRFIAHLVNFQVAHEVLALEILTLLLETPTDDSVEVAIGFLKECGQKLTEVTPRGINAIFERVRNVLHEGIIDQRVQYMVEVLFAVRKDHFKDYPSVITDLDLVEEEDQFTHLLTLEDAVNGEEMLNVFKPDPSFAENEEKYKILKKEILDEGSSGEDGSDSGSGSDDDDDDSEEEDEGEKQTIIDQTETNMVALRRTIYLTIQSSLDFEECAHKLMKMDLKPGQEVELCNMILDCCAQTRTYEKFFGLLAGRFCMIDKKYVEPFQTTFMEQYGTIHRLETNKLRNVAKFFAHLLHTDAISWGVLSCIKLNEEDTTSASRIFIKILFQELSEYLGLPKLNERLKDATLQEYFVGILPKDNPRDTRFAINFFTTIGLGGLTDDLREHLKNVSKKLMQQKQEEQAMAASSNSESSDDSAESDSSSEESSSSSSSSESSDDDRRKKKKKKSLPKQKSKNKDQSQVKEKKGKRREEEVVDRAVHRKDRENGAVEKKNKKPDRKKGKEDRKKEKQRQREEEEAKQREQEENFRRLARLANYGDIDNIQMDDRAAEPPRNRKEKGEKRRKGGNKNGTEDRRGGKERERDNRERDRYGDVEDLRRGRGGGDLDRDDLRDSRGFDPRDARDVDMYGGRPGLDRSYESRDGRGGGRRDDLDDDRPIKIERNFERLDLYEDKFERERRRNLEMVRDRGEFEDYLYNRGRDISRDRFDERDVRGRGLSAERYDERERGRGYSSDGVDDRERGRGFVRDRLGGPEWEREAGGAPSRRRSGERTNVAVREERRRRR